MALSYPPSGLMDSNKSDKKLYGTERSLAGGARRQVEKINTPIIHRVGKWSEPQKRDVLGIRFLFMGVRSGRLQKAGASM